MNALQDARPIFLWAKQYGDPKIIDRIVVRLLPRFNDLGLRLSDVDIEQRAELLLPADLVDAIRRVAEDMVHADHPEERCRV